MSLVCLLTLMTATLAFESLVRAQEPRLVVEIRSEHVDVRAGDEIPVAFVVANVGIGPYRYNDRSYDRSGRMPEYRLQAYDERGAQVPDPRMTSLVPQGYFGGGIGTIAELPAGARFSKTIALNLWALVTAPGTYTVRGSYYSLESGATVESAPITVCILPRSDEQMGRYIDDLAAQLDRADRREVRTHLIQRLMYTGDRRAARPLLALTDLDNNSAFWIGQAFSYYLPKGGGGRSYQGTASNPCR